MKRLFIFFFTSFLFLSGCSQTKLTPPSSTSSDVSTSVSNHEHNYIYSFVPAKEDSVSVTSYICSCGDQIITYGKWCPLSTIRYVSSLLWDSEPDISYDATVYLTMARCYDTIDKIGVLKEMKQYVPSDYKEIRGPDYYISSASNYFTTYYLYEDNVYLSYTVFIEEDVDKGLSWVGLKIETFIS